MGTEQAFVITVKPRNSGQLEQLDFFRYCGVFRYFEGSEALNRSFWGQKLSAIEGFSTILTSAIAGFYCIIESVVKRTNQVRVAIFHNLKSKKM